MLVKGIVGTDGEEAEPDEAFAKEEEKRDYSRTFCPPAGRTCSLVRFDLHALKKIPFPEGFFKVLNISSI